MRRNTWLAAAATTFVATACGRHARHSAILDAHASRGTPLRFLVLGDSLALGTGASSPTGGFAWRVFETFARTRPGSEITNLAIGGAVAADVLRLEVPRLAGRRADVAIVCVGGNDVVRRVAPQRYAALYARLIAQTRARLPGALVVCCGVPDVALSPLFSYYEIDDLDEAARAGNAAVQRIARANGALFFDLFRVTTSQRGKTAAFLSADQFHPSDEGHALIARALEALLERALQTRSAR